MRAKQKARQLPKAAASLLLCLVYLLCCAAAVQAADTTELEESLAVATEAVEDGTVDTLVPSARTELLAAIAQAEALMENASSATWAEIDTANHRLLSAIMDLDQVQADFSELSDAIGTANGTDTDGYTAASVATFETALEKAEDIAAIAELTVANQPEVDTAAAALRAAIDALAPEPATTTSPGSSPSTSSVPASGSTSPGAGSTSTTTSSSTTSPGSNTGAAGTGTDATGGAKTGDSAPWVWLAALGACSGSGLLISTLMRRRNAAQ